MGSRWRCDIQPFRGCDAVAAVDRTADVLGVEVAIEFGLGFDCGQVELFDAFDPALAASP